MNKIIAILGPTGIGKTTLSIHLAKKLNGEIINADSMQVYKELNIGTAKIKEKEKQNIPHHLFDICDVSKMYTVKDYQNDCRNKIKEIIERKKTPILVGGTGLYIKSVFYNYEFSYENHITKYDNLSNDELYSLVKKVSDIEIHKNNRKRLLRTLERYENNTLNMEHHEDELIYDNVYFIGLTTSREKLYEIVDKRVDKMIQDGLVEEARKFYDENIYSKALLTGIGYKELYQYFDGNISLNDAIELVKKNTRHYIKRQYTWFNNKMNVKWFEVDLNNFENTVNDVIKYLE